MIVKKILYIMFGIISFILLSVNTFAADCDFNPDGSKEEISKALEDCLKGAPLVSTGDNTSISKEGFSGYVKKWTNNIALYLGVLAVLGIAIGSFMLITSAGESDKASKAKNVIQWAIIGFVAVISAAIIINFIVNIMYSGKLF